jgi:hypothetical protein
MQTDQIQSQTNEQAPTEAPASLQLADLVLTLKLIQATAQRGAIRAEEMAEVGALYERLTKFLVASGAIKPAGAPAEENANG